MSEDQPSSAWVPATVGATVIATGTISAIFNLDKIAVFIREFGLSVTLVVLIFVALGVAIWAICRFLAPLVTRWFNRQDEVMVVMIKELPAAARDISEIRQRQEHFGEKIDEIHRATGCHNLRPASST